MGEDVASTVSLAPYVSVFLGGFIFYITALSQGERPLSVLGAFGLITHETSGNRESAEPFLLLTDAVITSLLGSIFVVILSDPCGMRQGLIMGLGMSGLIIRLAPSART